MTHFSVRSEMNLLNALIDIMDELKSEHKEEMAKLDRQHNERMAELQKQAKDAQINFEKSISKADMQINIAWGAFAISLITLVLSIIF